MQVFVPKEVYPGETRAPLMPETIKTLAAQGLAFVVESGTGDAAGIRDAKYAEAGATISTSRHESLKAADIVVRVRKPPADEVELLKAGCLHISFLDPFNERPLIESLVARKVSAISMEMIPRTTRAQKMDALSSQANLAGYVAVIIGAERLTKILPMMMTPAGTITPSRVFVIGAGVAGLQAIATAKRLGARVDAFDTRPVVEEQVHSLGAKFVKVDLGETGETAGGYAKELTPEQQAKQREAMAKVCEQADLVITTAKLFGRKAPVIVTRDMISRMRPGSVVVDLAVESGGNVEGIELDREVEIDGVKLIGLSNLEGRVSVHASQMYSANVGNFLGDYWDGKQKQLKLDLDDEIIKACLITHDGALRNEQIAQFYSKA